MAGGYAHIVQKDGNLMSHRRIVEILENGDDAFEVVNEMYGMIWFLAGIYAYKDPRGAVEDARKQYREGLKTAREVNG